MLKEIYKGCQNADFMGILRHNAKRYKTSQNRLTSTQRDNYNYQTNKAQFEEKRIVLLFLLLIHFFNELICVV